MTDWFCRSSAPMTSSSSNALSPRTVAKIAVTVMAGLLVLFAANALRPGPSESATSVATQSLLSLPVAAAPTTAPLIVPTTAPLSLPTATATPAPTATAVPTPTPAPTATAAPTAVPEPTPAPTVETASAVTTASEAEIVAEPEPTAVLEPTATPEPTPTIEVIEEPTATPEPTPTAEVIEEPTATPEPTPTPIPVQTIADLENYVLGEINQVRANVGLGPLALDANISLVSRDWSQQMSTGGFFEHRPSDQLNVMMPAGWLKWGENIASASNIMVAQDELEKSPGHYANMVGDYTHIGVGIYRSGGYVWVTQNFGRY